MRDIGVDIHKTNFQCCYLEEDRTEFEKYFLSELEDFTRQLRQTDRIAVESTGNSRWFMNQVNGFLDEVVVVNPSQFKVIVDSSKKTDKSDTELLAFYLSKGMLPKVIMKDEYSSQIKCLCNTRDKLVKLRTSLKNKIHNILLSHGVISKREDFSSEKGLRKAQSYTLGEVA